MKQNKQKLHKMFHYFVLSAKRFEKFAKIIADMAEICKKHAKKPLFKSYRKRILKILALKLPIGLDF